MGYIVALGALGGAATGQKLVRQIWGDITVVMGRAFSDGAAYANPDTIPAREFGLDRLMGAFGSAVAHTPVTNSGLLLFLEPSLDGSLLNIFLFESGALAGDPFPEKTAEDVDNTLFTFMVFGV